MQAVLTQNESLESAFGVSFRKNSWVHSIQEGIDLHITND